EWMHHMRNDKFTGPFKSCAVLHSPSQSPDTDPSRCNASGLDRWIPPKHKLMNFEAISAWLRNALLPYGGFGLMVLAMCDSSFLSLPEVNDILLMTFAINEPDGMVKFAFLTTVGSVIGCALLYAVGRKGGEAFLRRSVAHERLTRVQRWYQRHGVLAVIIPSLLPPPTPFTIFVLSAGGILISVSQIFSPL